ncbi:porin [Neiella sp. HB171785]|uniref:Porin n=1 Tax=Neiella litorisoli TaxID=2771431 RepID=A0A8J6QVG6_9GAMM|nr:DcaP family trimeric outer membrane transporter [Neiella litorisoli]MBD1390463.1 porin [Neiella litorisoli]
MRSNKLLKHTLATTMLAAMVPMTATAAVEIGTVEDAIKKTKLSFGGFIKVDSFWSDYSDGKLASNNIGRQFYVPSTIPVCSGECDSGDAQFDAHARTTRFNFGSTTQYGDHTIKTFLEMDFAATPNGNERVSNSYSPRMRHAFIQFDNVLVGQTWSTFQNTGALVESMDFIGVSEGTIFERQTQIRYTMGSWQFALENPETTITPYGGGSRISVDDSSIPDAVVRYNHKADWGHLALAGLFRNLDDGDETETAYGVSASGKVMVGDKNDIRFMANYGSGLGRYVGLNAINGAVYTENGDLEAIDTVSGFVGYRHWWSDKWRSNIFVSAISADNDTKLTGEGVTKQVVSGHLNLVYSPIPPLSFGVEYFYAEREIESGETGDMNRLIFSAKYAL